MISSRLARLVLACLALLCTAAISASGAAIYTTAPSDGTVGYQGAHDVVPAVRYAYFSETFARTHISYYGYTTNEFAVFEFPVASLRGTTLAPGSATLNVYCTLDDTGNTNLVRLSGENYDTGGVVTGDLYLGAKAFVADVAIPGAGAWLRADVTSDLQRQVDAGYNWATYYLRLDNSFPTAPEGNTLQFSTYEDTAHMPYLGITPVPEPSSLMALVCGAVGLGGMLIRRRK